MYENIGYNQILFFSKDSLSYHKIQRSFIENGEWILFFDNSEKMTINGKHIDTVEHRNRIEELLTLATESGYAFSSNSVKHHVQSSDTKLVLLKW